MILWRGDPAYNISEMMLYGKRLRCGLVVNLFSRRPAAGVHGCSQERPPAKTSCYQPVSDPRKAFEAWGRRLERRSFVEGRSRVRRFHLLRRGLAGVRTRRESAYEQGSRMRNLVEWRKRRKRPWNIFNYATSFMSKKRIESRRSLHESVGSLRLAVSV